MPTPHDHAKRLRHEMTDCERFVWQQLRDHRFGQFKFRRQCPIGPYIVDFACLENKIVLELDGGQHNLQYGLDANRTAFLESLGYLVLRFWNHDVLKEWDAIADLLWNHLQSRPPSKLKHPD